MTMQLDLFVAQAIEEVRTENQQSERDAKLVAEAEEFLFGKERMPVFQLDWTVCDLQNHWHYWIWRADGWEKRYAPRLKELADQLSKTNSRDRKARQPIKDEIARLQSEAHIADRLVHGGWADEVRRFDEEVVTPLWSKLSEDELEYAHDEFWTLATDRSRAELAWQWTLRECAELAALNDEDERWDEAVTRVKRNGERRFKAYMAARLRELSTKTKDRRRMQHADGQIDSHTTTA